MISDQEWRPWRSRGHRDNLKGVPITKVAFYRHSKEDDFTADADLSSEKLVRHALTDLSDVFWREYWTACYLNEGIAVIAKLDGIVLVVSGVDED